MPHPINIYLSCKVRFRAAFCLSFQHSALGSQLGCSSFYVHTHHTGMHAHTHTHTHHAAGACTCTRGHEVVSACQRVTPTTSTHLRPLPLPSALPATASSFSAVHGAKASRLCGAHACTCMHLHMHTGTAMWPHNGWCSNVATQWMVQQRGHTMDGAATWPHYGCESFSAKHRAKAPRL